VELLAESDAALDGRDGDLVYTTVADHRSRLHEHERFVDSALGLDTDHTHRLRDHIQRIHPASFIGRGHTN